MLPLLLVIGLADAASQSAGQILWRNTNGDVVLWFVSGGNIFSTADLGVVSASWTVQGTGDFDGDHRPDILWRNADGQVVIWFMSGSTIVSSANYGAIPLSWTVQATGDFDGDGRADILWRNTNGDVVIWFMNGSTIKGTTDFGVVPAIWTVQGTGDFNGDTQSDILWRNAYGDVVVWSMKGGTIASSTDFGVIPASWTIQSTGDFNGDATSDILWRNTNGDVVIWFMSGGTIASSADYGAIPSSWTIQGTGDFNADARTDILWRNTNGDTVVWFINGRSLASSADFGPVPAAWTPGPPPGGATPANLDVTTYHNDVSRTGAFLQESTLIPATVTTAHFGLLREIPVDGLVDAQPLVLVGFTLGGVARDVAYTATEHDSVYAFDANTGAQLWRTSVLGSGETPSDARSCDEVMPEIGITGTPVIDRAAGKIFLIAMSKDAAGKYHQRLHALDLTTGAEISGSPVDIAATIPTTGPAPQNPTISFDPGQHKHRSALLLSGGTIYTSWSSHCDDPPYTGWIMAYNESLQQTAVFNAEPSWPLGVDQGEGAFWNSASGPSADAAGFIYAMNGNGNFDTTFNAAGFPVYGDYGNAILKFAPPNAGTLAVQDYFTMFDTVNQSASDNDLGSGGLLLLPDQTDAGGVLRHLAVGGGKDSNLYVVNRDNLGKFNPVNNSNAYQFLPQVFPASSATCGQIFGVFGGPVYFNGKVYYGAAGDVIRALPFTAARLSATPTATTSHAFCYPGATMSVSANGSANGILWTLENGGPLRAFDATTLVELYDSDQAPNYRDNFGLSWKFNPPTITNGKVYVGTQAVGYQNYLAIFGPR